MTGAEKNGKAADAAKGGAEKPRVPLAPAIAAAFVLLAALLLANASKWYFRADFSRDKAYTLSRFSVQLLSELTETVQITYYVSEKLQTLYPQTRDIADFLREYAAASPKVALKIVDPQKEAGGSRGKEAGAGLSAEAQLSQLGIMPQQIQTSNGNETAFATVYSAVVIEYCGKAESIPFLLSSAGLEFDIDSRLQYLADGRARTAAVLVGNGFSLEADYPYLLPWLQSAGFSCAEVKPEELALLPPQTPLLVLGSELLDSDDVCAVETHVMQGASAAFCTSPNSINAFSDWTAQKSALSKLPELLDFWGVKIRPELVLDIANYRLTMQSSGADAAYSEYINYPFWIVTRAAGVNSAHCLAKSYYGLELYWPSPLELFPADGCRIEPLVKTSGGAWLMGEPFDTDPFRNRATGGSGSGETGEYTLAACLEGSVAGFYTTGKSPRVRIFVAGDQFLPSAMIEYTNSACNMDFITNVMLWLNGEDELLAIRTKGLRTTALDKITTAEGFKKARARSVAECFVLPLLLLAALAVLVAARRKKRV